MQSEKQLYAGFGKADITPAVGGHLYGYNDTTISISCHDPLDIKALALSDGQQKPVLFFSLSVGDFGTALADETRAMLSQSCAVPAENIIMSAIHTHSGPNVCGISGWGDVDRPYVDTIFLPAVRRAAEMALDSLAPAEYAIAEGQSEVGVNRRVLQEDGTVVFGQTPWAPQDKTMTIIRFRNAASKAGIFQFVHYGCHGTAAGNNHEITRDWIGVMLDRLEAETRIASGFWNGCVGDTGPRLSNGETVGDIHYAEELGGIAALDAVTIARKLDRAVYYRDVPVILPSAITYPCQPLPEKAKVDAYLATHPKDGHYINMDGLIDAYMRMVAAHYEKGEPMEGTRQIKTTVVTLGEELALCNLPFEVFSDICLRLRRSSPYPHTLMLSLTNGYEGYLPTRGEIPNGGYEVENARYGSLHAIGDTADTVTVQGFLSILRK